MLKYIKESKRGSRYAVYKCECGTIKDIRISHVVSGITKSCGCLRRRLSSERAHVMHDANKTHGLSKSRIYVIWHNMKQRCQNPNNKFYSYYGGRGINVCDRWQTFENFHSDMGDPCDQMTIDRIDNNGPYSPENCRWASRSEQQKNRRVNKKVTYNGQTLTLAEWSRITGIPRQTLYKRHSSGLIGDKLFCAEKQIYKPGLELGAKASAKKRRCKTHCKNGHEFTDKTTKISKTGGRSCKICHAIRERIRNGWDPENARYTPVIKNQQKHSQKPL